MFGYKLVKKKDLKKLQDNFKELAEIVEDYGIFMDENGGTGGDEGFDSDFVEKLWNKYWELSFLVRKSLRDLIK